jgi:hypothetical protein
MGSNPVKEANEDGFSKEDGDWPLAAACNRTESQSFHRNYQAKGTESENKGRQQRKTMSAGVMALI